MIGNYLYTRIRFLEQTLLAMVFSLMLAPLSNIQAISWNFVFLLSSFIVFRVIDDAGSVIIDRRIHPERFYIHPERFGKFKLFVIVLSLIYLAVLALIDPLYIIFLGTLLSISIPAYLIFNENYRFLQIISWLKYPILLTICGLKGESNLTVATASLFLIASYDLIEEGKDKKSTFIVGIVITFIAGAILFQAWFNIVYFLIPLGLVGLILLLKKQMRIEYYALILYPIIYILIKLIQL